MILVFQTHQAEKRLTLLSLKLRNLTLYQLLQLVLLAGVQDARRFQAQTRKSRLEDPKMVLLLLQPSHYSAQPSGRPQLGFKQRTPGH